MLQRKPSTKQFGVNSDLKCETANCKTVISLSIHVLIEFVEFKLAVTQTLISYQVGTIEKVLEHVLNESKRTVENVQRETEF